MIRLFQFVVLIGLVFCNIIEDLTTGEEEEGETTTRIWKRKKPAYWEFPETSTTERPDFSAEYCKSVNMVELGQNITRIVTVPVRGMAEPLIDAVVLYVLTLHRFIRKCNTTDDLAIRLAKELIQHQRPVFLDMELDMSLMHTRIGFDKYELQHFEWVWEDIQQSWQKLNNTLFLTSANITIT